MTFRGEYEHTLDDKGRLQLPAKLREGLGNRVALGRGMDGQINLYPEGRWEQLTARVEQAKQPRSAIRNVSRLIFSTSECELDRQGRIVVPAVLRRHAKLGAEVVIIGNDDHVEIWSQELWQKNYEEAVEQWRQIADDPEQVAELGLNI